MNLETAKNTVAIQKGYPSWLEMENLIDNNYPGNVGQLLVFGMEEAHYLCDTTSELKEAETLLIDELKYLDYWSLLVSTERYDLMASTMKERKELIKMTLDKLSQRTV